MIQFLDPEEMGFTKLWLPKDTWAGLPLTCQPRWPPGQQLTDSSPGREPCVLGRDCPLAGRGSGTTSAPHLLLEKLGEKKKKPPPKKKMKKKIRGGRKGGREGERKRKGENGVREGACRVRTGRSSTESQRSGQSFPLFSFPI